MATISNLFNNGHVFIVQLWSFRVYGFQLTCRGELCYSFWCPMLFTTCWPTKNWFIYIHCCYYFPNSMDFSWNACCLLLAVCWLLVVGCCRLYGGLEGGKIRVVKELPSPKTQQSVAFLGDEHLNLNIQKLERYSKYEYMCTYERMYILYSCLHQDYDVLVCTHTSHVWNCLK